MPNRDNAVRIVEACRSQARERLSASHRVHVLRLNPRYLGDDGLADVIEAVESQGWRLEHVAATTSGGGAYVTDDRVLLVFRPAH